MAPPVEISIPTTSLSTPADSSKPYTLYNITLRLPLRSFVTQKRYSEFHALHDAITSLVGDPPPVPLPSKSWFKSTVSSPELTEERRLGLESYLRAIAESPDRRWRDTAVWRTFCNLPPVGGGSVSAASSSGVISGRARGPPVIGLRDANTAAASDPGTWLDLHRELKAALHEARLCLARRDAAAAGEGSARAEAGGAAKKALVKAGSLLGALTDGLRAMREGGKSVLGDGEMRRRRDLLAAARVERDGLEKLAASLAAATGTGRQGAPSSGDKTALLGNGSSSGARSGGRVLGAPLPETERTRELDNEGVAQLQREMIEEQDQGLDVLAGIVRKQREMGLAIKDEVDRQVEHLDRVNEDVDRLGAKTDVAKNRVRKLG